MFFKVVGSLALIAASTHAATTAAGGSLRSASPKTTAVRSVFYAAEHVLAGATGLSALKPIPVERRLEDAATTAGPPRCPSIGEMSCTPDANCVCDDATPKSSGQSADGSTCYYCSVADGEACTRPFQCIPGESRCVDGACYSKKDKPLMCPDFAFGTISCETDASCECAAPTPQKTLTEDSGCHVCHAKADFEECSETSPDCSPISYCDIATGKCIPDTTCPSRSDEGRYSCNPHSTCECASTTATKTQVGDCYVCLEEDEAADLPAEGDEPAEGMCPDFKIGERFQCETDDTCECSGVTPNKSQFETEDGTICNLCNEKADDSPCSNHQECSPNSYCDLATRTCKSKTKCPTINPVDGGYSCNTDDCECESGEKYSVELPSRPGVFCHVCAAADDDDCTSDTATCSPFSYCDEKTKKCKPDNVCPERADTGRYSCNPEASCTCEGDLDKQVSIESTTEPGKFCHVCVHEDNDTCADWYECGPNSLCFGGVCHPASTCVFTSEEHVCTDDPACTCPDGRSKEEHEKDGGGMCYSCTLVA